MPPPVVILEPSRLVGEVSTANCMPQDNKIFQGPLAGVMNRNIRTLLEVRQDEERARGLSDKLAAGIAKFAGSIPFALLHAAIVVLWLVINLDLTPMRPFDPYPFVMLAMVASVEAIFLSTFVLINQNRMQELADRRSELDLQISLLAEHEITKLVAMVQDISVHLGLGSASDPEIEELKKDVAPEEVLKTIRELENEVENGR